MAKFSVSSFALYVLFTFTFFTTLAHAADQQPADRCNELAGLAGYPDASVKAGKASEFGDRKLLAEAVDVCANAMQANPSEKRYRYQLANVQFMLTFSKQGLEDLREAAEAGIAEAQYKVAGTYERDGIEPVGMLDTKSGRVARADAERYMRAAVAAGHRHANLVLVNWLVSGKVVKQNVGEAKALVRAFIAKSQDDKKTKFLSFTLAEIIVNDPASTPADYAEAQDLLGKLVTDAEKEYAKPLIAHTMRLGLGRPKDVEGARALLATIANQKTADIFLERLELALLALPDPKARAEVHALVEAEGWKERSFALRSADILLKGDVIGRDRLRGLNAMSSAAGESIEAAIRFAGEVKYHYQHEVRASNARQIVARLLEGAELGVPGAAKALIELKDATHEVFRDNTGAAALRDTYAKLGDVDAKLISLRWRGAIASQVPAEAKRVVLEIDALAAQGNARAHGLKAFLMTKGWAYRQDIAGAAKELQLAADGGDTEAMIQLADAYSSGAGVTEDQAKRVEWLIKASKLGSVKAKEELVRSKAFVWAGKHISARDGISEAVALYGDGLGRSYGGPFEFGNFSRATQDVDGVTDVPRAIMNGFAMSTAARSDELVVRAFKSMPKEIKLEIERILAAEKFLTTPPDGFMGPEARTALAAWAFANEPTGFASTVASNQAVEGEIMVAKRPALPALLQDEIVNKATNAALDEATAAKGAKQLKAALAKLTTSARYGSLLTRWTLVDNYLKVAVVREIIPASEIVGYAIDTMISDGADTNAQQTFADISHALIKLGKQKGLAEGILNTVRDDPRLHDAAVLTSVFKLMGAYDDVCPAWSKTARNAFAVSTLTANGCDDASRDALIAWAKDKGPSGIPEKLQRAAASDILAGK